jgi:MFS family permease
MIFLASAISNPLFGKLSDRGVGRWTTFALTIAGIIVVSFPHFSPKLAPLVFAVYGFFFMASYPMVEGALMGSVPHHIRGRVFGLFITIGGILGNLAHWAMGAFVKNLGPASARVESYYGMYWALAGLLGLSLLGLPCLRALRNREVEHGDLDPDLLPEKL